jgi:hypothetical protein
VIGFDSLTDDGLERLLATYRNDLGRFKRGEINYPCGSASRTVRRWCRQVEQEIASREQVSA